MRRLVLVGNPNVGKSAIFSRLTGAMVIAANYPGSTVEYTQGSFTHEGETCDIIDVPGTYALEGTCAAEEVAAEVIRRLRGAIRSMFCARSLLTRSCR
jgi:ferrous iron transport protein B